MTSMSFPEWERLSKTLKCAYSGQNFMPDDYTVKLWYSMLKDIPLEMVTMAVQQYILSNHFPPAVSDIRSCAVNIVTVSKDWSEGWADVQRCIHRWGMYRESEALADMDEVTRETVRRIGWQNICCADIDNEMADRANFRDIYVTIEKKNRERNLLPAAMIEKMQQVQGHAEYLIGE